MNQVVSFSDQKKSIKAFLDRAPDSQYAEISPAWKNLPAKKQSIEINRLKQIALVQVDKNPKLLKCDPMTIYASLRDAARLGLLPDSTTQEGHLVPFWSSKNKRFECQFMAGYKGLVKLAMRTGHVLGVDVRAVHANDTFSFGYGLNPFCDHIPAMISRGDFIGAYAVIVLEGGRKTFEYVSEEEGIEHGVKYTNAKDKSGEVFGNWADNPIPMIMKTALRKALKYSPLSGELDAAIHIDEAQHDPYYEHEPKMLEGGGEEITTPEEIEETETGGGKNGSCDEDRQGVQGNPVKETQGTTEPEKKDKETKGGKAGIRQKDKGNGVDKKPEVEYCPEGVCRDIWDFAEGKGIARPVFDGILEELRIKTLLEIPKGGHVVVMKALKEHIGLFEGRKK